MADVLLLSDFLATAGRATRETEPVLSAALTKLIYHNVAVNYRNHTFKETLLEK